VGSGRTGVKLSAFTIVDDYPDRPGGPSVRFAEVVRLAEAGESAGLASLWAAEHHFQPGGICPAPAVLLAACGARTRNLRLGVLVSVLPFHRPVEVAEQYALLDQLLEGRLNLGVGSGYIPAEFEGFGVDPATKRDRFDAGLATLLDAFAGKEVRMEGARSPVRLNVLPFQQPHPPIWIAVQRREAIPYVARRGVSIALIPYATVGGLAELAEEIREFRAALPTGSHAQVTVGLHLYAGEHPERARAALDRFLESRLRTQSTFFRAKSEADARGASRAGLEESDLALIGSPREVAERLEGFRRIGVDEVAGIFDFGGLQGNEVVASVRALGRAYEP
jgi:alkanesulfonate monooxygenase SsuD/methylene tetrahydromethanopterin reductase-like flavin-dependent oxidoreductase (luciferase family)